MLSSHPKHTSYSNTHKQAELLSNCMQIQLVTKAAFLFSVFVSLFSSNIYILFELLITFLLALGNDDDAGLLWLS